MEISTSVTHRVESVGRRGEEACDWNRCDKSVSKNEKRGFVVQFQRFGAAQHAICQDLLLAGLSNFRESREQTINHVCIFCAYERKNTRRPSVIVLCLLAGLFGIQLNLSATNGVNVFFVQFANFTGLLASAFRAAGV